VCSKSESAVVSKAWLFGWARENSKEQTPLCAGPHSPKSALCCYTNVGSPEILDSVTGLGLAFLLRTQVQWFFFFCLFETRSCYVAQGGFELVILLSQSPEY
jgi:hypothetical protein